MELRPPRIAIIGAGIGGLTAAACLRRIGMDVRIYEQARGFTRLGAGIQQAPNSIRVLYALGLKEKLLAQAFQPDSNNSRDHDTGRLTNSLPLGQSVLQRHGVPYFLMHRGDLHAMLADLVPAETVRLNHKLAGLDQASDGTVRLSFTNRDTAEADAVIGADGVHSVVRAFMLGEEQPRYTGRVAYRTVFPTALLGGLQPFPCVKWWGPDRHIVSYFVNPRRDELYFVTSTPSRNFPLSPGPPKVNWGPCVRPMTCSIRRCGRSSRPAQTCTNGRWSSAIHCHTGWRGTWRCWATPATR